MLLMWEGKVIGFVLSCVNFDDGLGSALGSASHAGQICCCPGFLVVTSQLYQMNSDLFGWWGTTLDFRWTQWKTGKVISCMLWWVLVSVKITGSFIGLVETG